MQEHRPRGSDPTHARPGAPEQTRVPLDESYTAEAMGYPTTHGCVYRKTR